MTFERIDKSSGNRDNGKRTVFAAIRNNAPVARIDIAAETGFSPATVTSITADLIAKGLIKEIPDRHSRTATKRGRPRVNLCVNGAAHLVAGIKLTEKTATVVLVDFNGKCVSEFAISMPLHVQTPNEICASLASILSRALDREKISMSDLSGVGVGLPGVVDARAGTVKWSPAISERDVPLVELLENKIGLPVFVDNDANLVTLAEHQFGVGRNKRNFIVVTIEQGVGMGIVIDGKLIRGNQGSGAELGHTKVQLDGALCRCGQRGCLEAYIGDYALLREASTILPATNSSGLSPNTEHQMQRLVDEARNNNQIALSIFRRAGRMFSLGLANVVNIFAPELIILAGNRAHFDFLYNEGVIDEMRESIVQLGGPPPDVRIHKWKDEMWAMGAAAFAIEGVTDAIFNRDTRHEI